MKKKYEDIFISLDPGFDSMKVVLNGLFFKFPFNVEPTDEKHFADSFVTDKFYLYRNDELRTWRVGEYARDLVFQNKSEKEISERMEAFYSEDRFLSQEFVIAVETAIILALLEYEKILAGRIAKGEKVEPFNIDEIEKHNFYLMVALPHKFREKYQIPVTERLLGHHEFDLRVGNNTFRHFKFKIGVSDDGMDRQLFTSSQTMDTIFGETSDDDGYLDEEKYYLLINGPTIVFDGGYYTFGGVPISANGVVDSTKSISDTDHAMRNVNIEVAKAVSTKRPDITPYVIEHLCSKDDGKIKYLSPDGKAEVINLLDIKKEKMQEVCSSFISSINEKYNHLIDFKYVVMAGGTGYCYFEQMKNYYTKETQIIDEDKFIFVNNVFEGKKYPIEYSIAVGGYKALKGKLASYDEDDDGAEE